MKSQIHENQKNNYLRLSKKSIVLLGMVLLVFNFTTVANNSKTTDKISVVLSEDNDQGDFLTTEGNPFEKRNAAPVEDQVILNPAVVMVNAYQKSLEEIIAENNQIIESNVTDQGVRYFEATAIETIIEQNNQIIESNNDTEIRPLYLDRTIEDQVAEDNAIIESDITSVFQPLDFETINKKGFSLKQNTNKLVGMN